MRTLSTRTLAALAYERGEEYDPAMAVTPDLMDALSAVDRAHPILPPPKSRHRLRGEPIAPGRWSVEDRDEYGPITGPIGLFAASAQSAPMSADPGLHGRFSDQRTSRL